MDAERSEDLIWQKSAGCGVGFGEAPREAGAPGAGAAPRDYLLEYEDLLSEGVGGEEIRQLLGMSEADEQLAIEILSAYEAQGGARSQSPAAVRSALAAAPRLQEEQRPLEHEDILSDVALTRTEDRLSDEALEAALAECGTPSAPMSDAQSAQGAAPQGSRPPPDSLRASGLPREQCDLPRSGESSPSPGLPRADLAGEGGQARAWPEGAARACCESEGAAPGSSPTPDLLRRGSSPAPAAVVRA